MMDRSAKIYVAGHTGLAGSSFVRELTRQGYSNVLLKTRQEVDLMDEEAVAQLMAEEKPDYVIVAAAKVGGILANNTYPADFLYENLKIELNLIHHAYLNHVKRLLFLGSSCIYPKLCPQPIREEYLLTGALEPTNEAYALAKISGLKLCQSYNRQYGTRFISAMPTNLYGINDNFDLETSHVLPALIRKVHEAKLTGAKDVTLWGTGTARREFLFVDDLARAGLFLLNAENPPEVLNVGVGEDISIRDLAELIRQIVGFDGTFVFDTNKPDGTPQKLLDMSLLHEMGWKAQTSLEDGIRHTYQWYVSQQASHALS